MRKHKCNFKGVAMRRMEKQKEVRVIIGEDNLCCPITQDIMKDPVIALDGVTYEREVITAWVSEHGTSPMTRGPMEAIFIPNRAVKALIDECSSSIRSSSEDLAVNAEEESKVVAIDYYNELLEDLAKKLSVQRKEMWHKNIVEQTLVAVAGIYTDQDGASFDKDNKDAANWNLRFCLNFASAEEHQLLTFYYRNVYAGSIIKDGVFSNYKAEIIFDTKIFHEQIIPVLADYKQNSHTLLMKGLSAKLNVDYNEVFNGDAVERRLVGQAGILTSQKNSSYRRNDDYSTGFSLSFSNAEEHSKFIGYYRKNYPDFIIREYRYEEGKLCKIDVNTKLLLSQIAPGLGSDFAKPVVRQASSGCIII